MLLASPVTSIIAPMPRFASRPAISLSMMWAAVASVALPAVPRIIHATKNWIGPWANESRTKPGAPIKVPAIITRRAPNCVKGFARTGAHRPIRT
jgi:hypothetical protein